MEKKTFIAFYMATFLAAYTAQNYDMNCLAGNPPKDHHQPIEDAATLAGEAWTKLQAFMTK